MISIVAQSARARRRARRPRSTRDVVAQGETTARAVPARVARRGRPEARAGDRHVLDLHRRARAQRLDLHGARSSPRPAPTARAALSSAVGALSGPAPRRRAGARAADARRAPPPADSIEDYVKELLDRGDRLMGFGHRVYRAEDPRARLLRGTAQELGSPRFEVAEELERGGARRAARAQARPRARDERRVLVGGRARRRGRPAAARAGDVRVLAHRRLVGAHPRAEAARPARPAVGALRRARPAPALRPSDGPRRGGGARRRARRSRATRRSSRRSAAQWDDEIEARRARRRLPRPRARRYRAIAQFRFRQKLELLRRGLEDESPAVRGSALIALEGLSRDHPGRRQRVPAAAPRARDARPERRRAAARDRLLQERHARPRDDPAPRRHRRRRRGRRRGARRPRARSRCCS